MNARSLLHRLFVATIAVLLFAPLGSRALADQSGPSIGPPTLDVSYPDGEWHEAPPLGGLRFHAGAYDPKRDRLWIHGGVRPNNGGSRDELWAYDLGANASETICQQIQTTGERPGPSAGHWMGLDAARDRMIMFREGEIWTLSLSGVPQWAQVTPLGTPPPVDFGHALAIDAVHDRLLLCGGGDGVAYFTYVWSLSLGDTPEWTEIATSGAPAGRWGAAGVYDPPTNRLIIAAGAQGSLAMTDTWALDLTTSSWTQLASTGVSGGGATMVLDPVQGQLVRLGGSVPCGPGQGLRVMSLSGGSWSIRTFAGGVPVQSYHMAAYDSRRNRMLVHGGGSYCEIPGSTGDVYYDDLYGLSLESMSTWVNLTPAPLRPSDRRSPLACYVGPRHEMLIVGGIAGISTLRDVWSLHLDGPPQFSQVPVLGTAPYEIYGTSAVYDEARDRIVFFSGGSSPPTSTVSVLKFEATSTTWQSPVVVGTPVGRRFHTAIIDPVGDRMIVFGGTTNGSSSGALNDVWQLTLSEPMTWSPITPAGVGPEPLYGHDAIYDPVRHRMISYGDGGTGTQTWELSLGSSPQWTMLSGSSPAGSGPNAHLVYDSNRDRMVVYNGGHFETPSVWEYPLASSSGWRQLVAPPPPGRSETGVIFDPLADRLVAFGGTVYPGHRSCSQCAPTTTNELWTMDFPANVAAAPHDRAAASSLSIRALPNPSRIVTTFELELASAQAVRLDAYDVTGRRVQQVFSGRLEAGSHRLRWDGRDPTGQVVSPGLYFVRARVGDVDVRRAFVRVR